MIEETGRSPADIAYAFAAVMAVYQLRALYAGIDALDCKIDGQSQLCLYRRVQDLLQKADRLVPAARAVQGRARTGDRALSRRGRLPDREHGAVLPEQARARLQEEEAGLEAEGFREPCEAHRGP